MLKGNSSQQENMLSGIFFERLRKFFEASGLTQAELAVAMGCEQSDVSRYLKGRMPLGDKLVLLARRLGVTTEDLFGFSPVIQPQIQTGPPSPPLTTPRNWGGPYWGTTNLAPVISWARAGEGGYYEDQGSDVPHVPVACKDANCYVLTLEGDSMEPVFLERDLLVVAPNLEPSPGDHVIAKTMDDEVLFKIFRPREKHIVLVSYNPLHEPRWFTRSEIRKIHPVQSVIRPLKGKIF